MNAANECRPLNWKASLQAFGSKEMDNSAALVLAPFDSSKERVVHRSQIYTWGNNQLGQTGHTGASMQDPRAWKVQRSPKLMELEHFKGDAALVKVACGLQHTGALTREGELFMWGSNDCGQLGDGTETDRRQPRRVKALQTEFVTSIACGHQSSAALARPRNKKGAPLKLWVWGQHQGSNFPRPFHGAFAADTPIVAVSLGAAHAAAVSAGGQLMTWGYNEVGQLGHGFSSEGLQPARLVRAFIQHTSDTPVQAKVKKVACGAYHTACVSDAGEVYTFGHGAMGQLGHRMLQGRDREVNPRRVVSLEGQHVRQIACGQAHTCAITSKGTLYMWGGHWEGQLGLGRPTYMFPFVDRNQSNDFFRRLPTVLLPQGAKMVVCGQTHTLACTMDGRLWGWGYNSCGQAATGKETHAWVPTPIDWCVGEIAGLAAGGGHSAVLMRACSLKDLCELRLAESLNLNTICRTKAVAAQMHADSLARYCELYRLKALGEYQDDEFDEDEERRRRPR